MVKVVSFKFCIFYHNKKKFKIKTSIQDWIKEAIIQILSLGRPLGQAAKNLGPRSPEFSRIVLMEYNIIFLDKENLLIVKSNCNLTLSTLWIYTKTVQKLFALNMNLNLIFPLKNVITFKMKWLVPKHNVHSKLYYEVLAIRA